MKIITCNFRGRKHSERNEPCEDSVYYLQGSAVTTVAVADGAGSKKYEHAKEGADAVTKAICNFFDAKFDDFFESSNELELRSVIQTIYHKALKERAKELELESIETMASTLLAVSIKGNKLISVQIGDGLIGRFFHEELETITMPQNGEYASSTYFINNADAYKMVQIRKMFLNGTSHLFLMTDGVADCMFNDFNGEFNESLKMILEASDEPKGEDKVQKAVKEFIVDADPMSDDCTLAVVCFNERKCPIETETLQPKPAEDVKSADDAKPEAVAENEQIPFPQAPVLSPQYIAQQINTPSATEVTQAIVNMPEVEKKKAVNWKLISIIAAAVLVVVIAVVSVVLVVTNKGNDEKGTTKQKETSSFVSENTTTTTTPSTSRPDSGILPDEDNDPFQSSSSKASENDKEPGIKVPSINVSDFI